MPAKFIPLGDRILVHNLEQGMIIEGVLIPDSAKADMLISVIVAIGDSVSGLNLGDRVGHGPWAGKEMQIDGIPFRVLRFEEIDGKVVAE